MKCKINYKHLSEILNAVCGCRLKNNITTYLKAFGSGMSAGFVRLNTEGTAVPTRAMLSVRYTAIAAQKFSHVFQQCSCLVYLVLSNNLLLLYDQVANLLSRQTKGVVNTLNGILPGKANIKTARNLAPVLLV